MKTVALLAFAGVATSAAAQDLTINVVERAGGGTWDITANFNSMPPSDIVQVWADAEFEIVGAAGIDITIDESSVNASYSTDLGPFIVDNNGTNTVKFTGNANAFFGTPDATNPLSVLTFSSSQSSTEDMSAVAALNLIGQNSAIFDEGAFGDVQLYQDALGDAGPLSFEVNIVPIPAPASAALLGLGGLAAARRRR